MGKLPPQAVDLEEAVLGALMLEANAPQKYGYMLSADLFYKDAHQLIYSAIAALSARNESADILTVTQELKKEGKLQEAGGAYYVTNLTNNIASAANLEYHIRIITEKYYRRKVIQMCQETLQDCYEDGGDVFDLIGGMESELLLISQPKAIRTKTLFESMQESQQAVLRRMERRRKGEIDGVPSGYVDLDKITGGFQNTDLVLIAGRPSMGKTALGIRMALNAAKKNIKSCFFSIEMSGEKLTDRIILGESNIDGNSYRLGYMKDFELSILGETVGKLAHVPMFIDDTSKLSIAYMRSIIRNKNPQIVFVDYLQLMDANLGKRTTIQNREQEISFISRSLKQIAKEHEIPVVALCQLSREVEKRHSRKPQLSDLRESGSLEQDADVIIFPWRPAYYGMEEDDKGNSLKGFIELVISKHRNGPTGKALLKHNDSLTQFYDMKPEGIESMQEKIF